jgi:iron complex outermembrane receptor protein
MAQKILGLSLILLCGASYASEDELHLSDDSIPLVITPSRLKQSLQDVPASVTIITRDTIRALGIRSIPEALRLVPGITEGQAAGNDYRLEYHGTNGQLPARMGVSLNGISLYGTEAARVYWDRLPVSIDDVDRIEVTRGPNSAAYGSNSLLASINIITKHPEDTLGLTVSTLNGSLSTRDVMARYGHAIGNTSFRITLDHQEDEGFDFNETQIEERHDGTEITRFNVQSVTQYDNSYLDLQVGLADTHWEDEYEEDNETSNPDADWEDYFISSTWGKSLSDQHSIQLRAYGIGWERKQYWNSCYPTLLITPELRALSVANEQYALTLLGGEIPTGGTPEEDAMVADVFDRIASLGGLAGALAPTCARVNQNFDRAQYDIEFQDTYVFSEKLRSVMGIGLRHDEVQSET